MDSPSATRYSKLDAEQPCLNHSDDGSLEQTVSWTTRFSDRPPFWKKHAFGLLVHLVCICVYSLLALCIIVWSVHQPGGKCSDEYSRRPKVYTPAREGAYYGIVTTNVNGNPYKGKFTGNPGPEVDGAWQRLLRATNLRISRQDLKKLNRTSLPLADGSSDHWASMEVYHHLHCLKAIRHYIAIDHYPGDTAGELFIVEPGRVYPEHIEHCIEALRLHLICQPDLSVYTYAWHDDHQVPYADHKVAHECVDWPRLEEWAHEHSFSMRDRLIQWPNGTTWIP